MSVDTTPIGTGRKYHDETIVDTIRGQEFGSVSYREPLPFGVAKAYGLLPVTEILNLTGRTYIVSGVSDPTEYVKIEVDLKSLEMFMVTIADNFFHREPVSYCDLVAAMNSGYWSEVSILARHETRL